MLSLKTTRSRLRDLDDRLRALEKTLQEIRVEWEEWYDKYRRLYARLNKRIADAQQLEMAPERPADGRPPGPPTRPEWGRVTNPAALALLGGARRPVEP
jgi:hypothetical protein